MGRVFLPLDVDFEDDDKVARLARYTKPCEARAVRDLLVAMWRYCKRERSDGSVPAEIVGKLVYPDPVKIGLRDADRLVECGLAQRTPDGYYLPGYLKRNKSRAQLEAEAAQKAEAGRKGGKASGEVRKAEAEAKQGASEGRSHRHRQSTETKTETGSEQERGDRPVTLRPVDDTEPTPTIPADARCTAHRGVKDPGPCNGCRAARERAERKAEAAAEQAAREAERAARDCTRCDGTWVIDEDTKLPTRRRCDHRRTA